MDKVQFLLKNKNREKFDLLLLNFFYKTNKTDPYVDLGLCEYEGYKDLRGWNIFRNKKEEPIGFIFFLKFPVGFLITFLLYNKDEEDKNLSTRFTLHIVKKSRPIWV